MVFLVRNQGRLVTKNELLDAIWPDTAVEENNLNKSIRAIRHALGQKPRDQKYIETVPNTGTGSSLMSAESIVLAARRLRKMALQRRSRI